MTNRTKIALSASTILSSMALAATAQAQSLPSGGVVREGSATISTAGTTQTINQTSQRAVIEWTDFSIADGSTVDFTQPNANAATLNRVTSTTPSTIAGDLNANGAVYIINPNGIQITGSGMVDVGRGFVASTLDITDADFMAGSGTFGGDGTGTVDVRGIIDAGPNGYIGLLGGQTRVSGFLAAPAGTIVIGAVEAATLDLNGGGFLQLVMPGVTPGSSHIAMGTDSARAAVRGAVYLPGSVEATYVTGTNGNVTLGGALTGEKLLVAGTNNVTVDAPLVSSASAVFGARGNIVLGELYNVTQHVILRADAAGTGSGTVSFGASGSMELFGSGQVVDIFYNPASYAAPTDFSAAVTGTGAATATVNAYMLVNDVNQLQAIETNVAGTYALGRDIDASATAGWNGGEGFDPIGTFAAQFTGTLNGQGHAISDLTIDQEYGSYVGLFASLGSGSLIHDLSLDGGSVTGYLYTGALASESYAGTIRNVSSSVAVTGVYYVGGLVGVADDTAIANVFVSGAVSGDYEVGGLVGDGDEVSINNAFVSGAVSGDSDVGGLIGFDIDSTVSNVHVSGRITGSSDVGGVIGDAILSDVSNAYWDSYSTGQSAALGYDGSNVLDATAVTSDPAQSAAANYAFSVGTYSDLDLTNTWYQVDGLRPILRSLANPAVGGVIDITNVYQLQLMGANLLASYSGNLRASYSLANDIDASLTDGSDISGIWDSRGFAPVGDGPISFLGVFDGQGHVISGLTINRPDETFIGLIGFSRGEIRNVGLEDVSIVGRSSVGAIAGGVQSSRSIEAVYSTGSVQGDESVGGLIGALVGGNVQNAYSTVTVSGEEDVGGLVGSVSDSRDDLSRAVTFDNVYATGAVSGTDNVGGLIGNLDVRTLGNAPITNAYATGAVSGLSDVGGLVGYSRRGTFIQTYWDTETTGQATSAGGTGLTTAQMQQAASFTGWDISGTGGENTIWRIYEGSTAPLLRSFLTPLTVSQTDATVTYDGTVQSLNSFTLGSGGDPALVFGTLTANASGTDVGTYTFTDPAGLYSVQQGYDLVAGSGTLTIDPRAITVTADAQSRIYGDANPALTYTVGGAGLVGSDTLSGALVTAATVTSNIGTYAITQGTLAASSNYTLTYVGADLTVTPRALSVVYTADALSRIYGDANPALTGSVAATGLVNGDTLSGTASWTTPATATSGVGSYSITGSGLTASSNYTLTSSQAAGNADALTITPRALTVTADALSRIYGDANPALTYAIGGMGLANGDTLSGALATAATATSDVGTYGISQGTLAATSNYTLTYVGADLTVTPRALSVVYTADALSRIYGEANPALAGSVAATGLVNGDALSGTASWTTAADQTSGVGSYDVTGSGLTASSNYTLTGSQAASNATALTITPRVLTVTADALSRIYGDANPALTYAIGGMGLANGDTLAGVLETAATVTSDVGHYAITQGSLEASSNYTLTYVGADLTVTPRALSVVYAADAASRIYGNANPALSGSVAATGLVNGDALLGTASWTTPATATSGVGSYSITGSGLTASSNYTLTSSQAAGNADALTITPRALTVTADALSRIYGDANPALSYVIGGMGLANGDTLSGALATAATATSDVGTYGISQGTLAATSNYTLDYEGANLVITPRTLLIVADTQTRVFGYANPDLTYGVSGLVNGDSLTGVLTTEANIASLPGRYLIAQGTLAASTNYIVDYTPADLVVAPVEMRSVSHVIGSGLGFTQGNTVGGGVPNNAPTLNSLSLSVNFGAGSQDVAENHGEEADEPAQPCPDGSDAASGCQLAPM